MGNTMNIPSDLMDRHESLRSWFEKRDGVAVAFSAGVDSTYLLKVAHDVLGDRAVAYTALSVANPTRESDAAAAFCAQHGIRQVTFAVDELSLEGFDHNPVDRCYRCKGLLFDQIVRLASEDGFDILVEGSNVDDLGDYRPGRRALEERGVASPLMECGFTKQDIRAISRALDLPTWDKPSFACLFSRFAYGDLLTVEKLRMVDAAEQFLLDKGFKTVRVRVAEGAARIEVAPDDIARLAESPLREEISQTLKGLGFTYVSLDLQGYRTGSMNETLD